MGDLRRQQRGFAWSNFYAIGQQGKRQGKHWRPVPHRRSEYFAVLLDWRAQMARQRLGQHFLGDVGWRGTIARAIRVSSHGIESTAPANTEESCWIEVGAGHGEMTEHLVQTGAPVYAIELDPLLTERLRALAKKHPNLTVVPGDVLETDLATIAAGRRIKIYGNLPYYITSPILHHFFQFASHIDEIHLVIQLEGAERLTA